MLILTQEFRSLLTIVASWNKFHCMPNLPSSVAELSAVYFVLEETPCDSDSRYGN